MKLHVAPDFKALVPPLEDRERAELVELMRSSPAAIPPVLYWSNGPKKGGAVIVDGMTREIEASKLGIKLKYVGVEFEDRQAAMQFTRRVQLSRRNLTPSQYALLYAEYNQHRTHGGDRRSEEAQREQANRRNLELAAPDQASTLKHPPTPPSATLAAANKVVARGSDELKEAVSLAEFSVFDAAAVTDLPKTEQNKVLNKAKREGTTVRAAAKPKPEKPAERQWGDGDRLEDVQADLEEFAKRCRDLNRFARLILRCEENEITRPFCGEYSLLTVSHPLLHVARVIKNDMPVGGTPKRPVLYHEEKAKSLA